MKKLATKEQIKRWNTTYYLKNKVKRRAQYTAYRRKILEWYREMKKSLKCEKCGFSHPAALSFHHKDKTLKTMEVSLLVTRSCSRKRIEEEIAKCEILCHNCHAILHYEEIAPKAHVEVALDS